MGKKLVIFGSGNIAELAHFYFDSDSDYEVAGFTVDEEYKTSDEFLGLPLVAFDKVAERFPPSEFDMFIAVSYAKLNKLRAQKFHEALGLGYRLPSYVSSRACVFSNVEIGRNCFILENNVVQPFAKVGDNVTLWSGNHIGHHSRIEDHCFLASHIVVSGGVVIEPYCFIGVNATLRDHIVIKRENVIGGGAIIMKSTEEKQVFVPQRTQPTEFLSDTLKRI